MSMNEDDGMQHPHEQQRSQRHRSRGSCSSGKPKSPIAHDNDDPGVQPLALCGYASRVGWTSLSSSPQLQEKVIPVETSRVTSSRIYEVDSGLLHVPPFYHPKADPPTADIP